MEVIHAKTSSGCYGESCETTTGNSGAIIRGQMSQHVRKKKHICQVCDKGFLKPSQLVRHLRCHTGEKPFKCERCDKSFNQKGTLDAHIQALHDKAKPFTCELCSSKFAHKSNLKVHQKTVHDIGRSSSSGFRCEECSCVFQRSGTLRSHILKIHGKDPSKLVSLSSQGTINGSNFNNDKSQSQEDGGGSRLANGSGEVDSARLDGKSDIIIRKAECGKRLSCKFCEKRFTKPIDLTRHERVHTKERPFKCDTCAKSFSLKSTLNSHVERRHNPNDGNRRTKCRNKQVTHSKSHDDHTEEAKEEVQGTETTSSNMIASKNRSNKVKYNRGGTKRMFLCSQCPSSFKKSSHLKQHILRHSGEQPYQCFLCNKRFVTSGVLNYHIKSHLGEKPHRCQNCGDHFTTKGSLRRHLKKHADDVYDVECLHCRKHFTSQFSLKRHSKSCPNIITRENSDPNLIQKENLGSSSSLLTQNRKYIPLMETIQENQNLETSGLNHGHEDPAQYGSDSEDIQNPTQEEIQQTQIELQLPGTYPLNQLEGPKTESSIQFVKNRGEATATIGRNQCHVCGKFFSKHSDLVRHNRIHSGEKPFQCHTCGRRFRVKSTCISHMRIHESSTKTATCDICKKHFATMSSLRLHMRLHTGVRPFKCAECNRDFRTAGHLQAHKKSHLRRTTSSGKSPQQKRIYSNESFASKSPGVQSNDFNFTTAAVQVQGPESASELFLSNKNNDSGPLAITSESECMKLLGSLRLPIDNLQNILITSVDMSNMQVEDFFQKFVVINNPSSGPAPIPTQTDLQVQFIDSSLDLGRHTTGNLNFPQQVSNLDPFLSDAPAATEKSKIAPLPKLCEELNEANENDADKEKHSTSKQCPDCGRIFFKPSQMLRHQLVHTGEKPHVCGICKNTFSQKSSLDTHMMFTHSEVRPFQCTECPFKTVQRGALKKHCSRAHPQLNFTKVLESTAPRDQH